METLSATCKSNDTPLDIDVIGNTIVIKKALPTPHPCHVMRGEMKITGNKIEVNLHPKSKDTVCIQCIGEVVGQITISNLPKGTYSLVLETPKRVLTKTIRIEE
jgi:hypothetical protein